MPGFEFGGAYTLRNPQSATSSRAWQVLSPTQKTELTKAARAYIGAQNAGGFNDEYKLDALYSEIFSVLNIKKPASGVALGYKKLVEFLGVLKTAEHDSPRLPHVNELPAALLEQFGARDDAGALLAPPAIARPITDQYSAIITLRDAAIANAKDLAPSASR